MEPAWTCAKIPLTSDQENDDALRLREVSLSDVFEGGSYSAAAASGRRGRADEPSRNARQSASQGPPPRSRNIITLGRLRKTRSIPRQNRDAAESRGGKLTAIPQSEKEAVGGGAALSGIGQSKSFISSATESKQASK